MAAEDRDLNRDPITDEPGAHPVGTGVGATGGAVAGAAAGVIGGPVGVAVGGVVGGVVGAVVGGLAGKAAAEAVNPTAEEAHWREHYTREPYYEQGRSFDDYGPAYRHGLNARLQHEGDWDKHETRLGSEWDSARAGSGLSWDQAKPATQAAWERADRIRHGEEAGTGRSAGVNLDSSYHTAGTDLARSTGTAGMVGAAQSAGNTSGDTKDVIDALQDLVECCKDGEYGFRACAEQAQRQDLKSLFLQRAEDCSRGARELNEQIRSLGGRAEDSGSALGAVHRGWVSMKTALTSYDDKAVLNEAERGEDNALARYRKALKQPLPAHIKQLVEKQYQGVQKNHDQVKMLRDSTHA